MIIHASYRDRPAPSILSGEPSISSSLLLLNRGSGRSLIWFEKTCRELSKDQGFALPYWDWTAAPRIPASFFEDVLDPMNPDYYITSTDELQKRFTDPIHSFWSSLSDRQRKQLALRAYNSVDDILSTLFQTFGMFSHSRTPTPAKPDLDSRAQKAVSLPVIRAALAPRTFVDFAGAEAVYHSQGKLKAKGPGSVAPELKGSLQKVVVGTF